MSAAADRRAAAREEKLRQIRQHREWAKGNPKEFAQQVLNLRAFEGEHTLDTNPDLSWEMDDWQVELMEAVADIYRHKIGQPTKFNHTGLPYVTVRAMHGPGKSFGMAALMHWFNYCWPGLIAATAPKMDQLKTRLWREFRKIQMRAHADYRGLMKVDATKITWGGSWTDANGNKQSREWYALAETASRPENLQGLHDRYMMFLIDEASGVTEEIFPVIISALSNGYLPILVMIGNPTQREGFFASSHLDADISRDYYRMHISLDKTRRVSRKWVDTVKRMYGENSPVFKVRCLGEFADASANQLITLVWIEKARNREIDIERGDGSIPRIRVSVDVADGGLDETVFIIARHYASYVLFLRCIRANYEPHVAPIESAREAMRLFDAWGGNPGNGDDIVVDASGVGAGTAGAIMLAKMPNGEPYPCTPYRGGESSADPQRWRNKRVQSYLNLRDAFRDDAIVLDENMLPDRRQWTEFEGQLCSIQMDPASTRVEDLMTKEEMKREGMKSPDMADAAAMQYAGRAPRYTGMHSTGADVEVYAEELTTFANY